LRKCGGDLGLIDAVEEGGFDGLEADEDPLVVGELLEERTSTGDVGEKWARLSR
jgi:hypothetical protein